MDGLFYFMENPMNKWTIWGVKATPIFGSTPICLFRVGKRGLYLGYLLIDLPPVLGGQSYASKKEPSSRWWFQTFFEFSSLLGEMIQID